MHSPLPDASALEAGIIEDELPTRLSRVQENVRILLATSRLGSVPSSPRASPIQNQFDPPNGLPTPPDSPFRRASLLRQPEVIPSPSAESTSSATTASTSATQSDAAPEIRSPPSSYRRAVQRVAHQSTLFNTRAVAALNHPDLTDPSMALCLRLEAGRHRVNCWKRPRNRRGQRAAVTIGSSQSFLCVFAALLLAATVATYIVLATTLSSTTPAFHIMFIIGILLATIVFAHSLVRVFLFGGNPQSSRKVLILPASRSKRHHHRRAHRRQHRRPREIPTVSNDLVAYVPETPIPVHMPIDEVRPDSREAHPTATLEIPQRPNEWDKDVESLPNPPPAYGRWRGSVRANPDFLHWQPVPSPVDEDLPDLPSPTYEEAISAARTGPPSYVTRDSPARRREMRAAGSEVDGLQSPVVEPEMVEVRGFGLAV